MLQRPTPPAPYRSHESSFHPFEASVSPPASCSRPTICLNAKVRSGSRNTTRTTHALALIAHPSPAEARRFQDRATALACGRALPSSLSEVPIHLDSDSGEPKMSTARPNEPARRLLLHLPSARPFACYKAQPLRRPYRSRESSFHSFEASVSPPASCSHPMIC